MFITQEVDFEGIQETREEKVFLQTLSLSSEYVCANWNQTTEAINKCETQMYRNWMNSLGVSPRVNYLYSGSDFVLTAKSLSLSFSISSKKFDFMFS